MVAYVVYAAAVSGLLLLLRWWRRGAAASARPLLSSLRGKHVLITGGSSGIGFEIARRCVEEGAFLTLLARNPAKLAEAHRLLTSSLLLPPDSILIKAVDVSNAAATADAIKESFEWRPIDVLVCCAGLAAPGMFDGAKVSALELVARTNLLGCAFTIHAALPLMKSRSLQHPSSIVIMDSLAGLLCLYGSNMYTITKFALKGLAETLRFELLPWNIRVSLVCPGFTETPMLTEVRKEAHLLRLVEKMYLLRRDELESAEEVARLTIEGLKRGKFLVTTTFKGFLLGVLTRGFVPADSVTGFLAELFLAIPLRFLSLWWVGHVNRTLCKEVVVER